MRLPFFAALFLCGSLGAAHALTLVNTDPEAHTVTVTENGVRSEVTIEPNARMATCEQGCFVTFPGGDMMVFKGAEEVVIEGGKARILKK
ncbi:MAG: hypothetical protein AAGF28_01525 [Pseudomonadota bacterium]